MLRSAWRVTGGNLLAIVVVTLVVYTPIPPTTGDLRYIQGLKRKHRIDYDSHGSYRFVEP